MAQIPETADAGRVMSTVHRSNRDSARALLLLFLVLAGCTAQVPSPSEKVSATSVATAKSAVVIEAFDSRIILPITFERTKSGSDFRSQSGLELLAEFVPAGENVYNWSELISFRGYDARAFNGAASFQVIDWVTDQVHKACPGSFLYEAVPWPTIGKLDTAAALMGCRSVENSYVPGLENGQSEVGLYVVARTEQAYFELHYSRRMKGDTSEFDEAGDPAVQDIYERFLNHIKICARLDSDEACS